MGRGSSRRLAEVRTVRETRELLSSFLKTARQAGADAPPEFFGAQRKPEGVVLSYERYLRLMDDLDNAAIIAVVEEREAGRGEAYVELDDAMRALGFDPDEHELE